MDENPNDVTSADQPTGPEGAGTASTPAAPAPAISPGAAFLGVFLSPKETFQRLMDRPWWFALLPLVLVGALSMVGSYLFMTRVDMAQFVRDQIRQSRFASQMSDAQIEEAAEKAAQRPKWIQPVIGFFVTGVVAAVLAAIFWLVLLAFGSEITYGRSFQATGWAFLPGVLTTLIFIVLLMVKDANAIDIQNPLMTNPAALIGKEALAKPLYTLLGAIDIFKLWIVALLSVGLAAAGRTRIGRAAAAVISLYVLWVLIRVAFAAIF